MDPTTRHVVRHRRVAYPPAILYRVEHTGNRTALFRSRAKPFFYDDDDYWELLDLHLNWSNTKPTPFLSTFASERHAYNWAAHRFRERGDRRVCVHEVYTDGLVVFRAGGDEFLVFDEVPRANLGRTLRPYLA